MATYPLPAFIPAEIYRPDPAQPTATTTTSEVKLCFGYSAANDEVGLLGG